MCRERAADGDRRGGQPRATEQYGDGQRDDRPFTWAIAKESGGVSPAEPYLESSIDRPHREVVNGENQ